MVKVVGVRFKDTGKMYYFDPQKLEIKKGDSVIVETARGVECGVAASGVKEVDDSEVVQPLKPIIRVATDKDLSQLEENKKKADEAYSVCKKKIADHGLEMDLTEVEYTFDRSKIIFYFTAEGRVDFRELVKDLASEFHTRIELRQIGVRDEAKMLGGLGICGRPFCCSTFLNDFHSVSIKMAKEQGLSLSPGKISGCCGRLMCCLKYEQNSYEYLNKITPRIGTKVDCREGRGVVVDSAVLTGVLKVRLDSMPDGAPVTVNRSEVRIVK
ncbi:MAG: stage 0 sporulation protein [Ruminococcaceae bacterium]|jgi:cell fate regulator YaaT (PSP1 superfamily)|nr:stage 0 sporulation protein [Oscillospiraceae bacterium]